MGLSIYYSGRFREASSLPKMIDEIKDIAETFKWDFTIYNEQFPKNNNSHDLMHDGKVYGISFTPPECETVSISFLSNRKMSSNAHLEFYGNTDKEPYSKYLYMLSVKTQFAGIEVHKFIIQLFRYLEKKNYFEEFSLIDDGKYWETGDEKLLANIFKKNVELLDSFSFAIESIPIKNGESYEKYFERVINMINARKKE